MVCLPCLLSQIGYLIAGLILSLGTILGYKFKRHIAKAMRWVVNKFGH